jgi:hypothetical protein
MWSLQGRGVDFDCQHYHHHCHMEGNFDIWIWTLLLGIFHHCCGTWMNLMEPPKSPINIWPWWFHLIIFMIIVICNIYVIHNNSHLSWHGKDCFNIWNGHWWTIITSSCTFIQFKLKSAMCHYEKLHLSKPHYLTTKIQKQLMYNYCVIIPWYYNYCVTIFTKNTVC